MNTYIKKPSWELAFEGATHLLMGNTNGQYIFAQKRNDGLFYPSPYSDDSLLDIRFVESCPTNTAGVTGGPEPRDSRKNHGKTGVSMVLEAKHAIEGIGKVLEFGAKKYDRGNWRKGLSHTEICDSLIRHLSSYLAGEDNDIESKLPHVDHIATNALFLSEMTRTNPELDDRSKVSQTN